MIRVLSSVDGVLKQQRTCSTGILVLNRFANNRKTTSLLLMHPVRFFFHEVPLPHCSYLIGI